MGKITDILKDIPLSTVLREMLKEMEKNKGGRPSKANDIVLGISFPKLTWPFSNTHHRQRPRLPCRCDTAYIRS